MGACPRVEPVPSEGRGGDIGIVPVGYRFGNVGNRHAYSLRGIRLVLI